MPPKSVPARMRWSAFARVQYPPPSSMRGKVLHVEPRVDPATGARNVRIGLEDALTDVPAGLTVTVNLVIDRQKAAISVPRGAIAEPGGAARVRIVRDDGVVMDRAITFVEWPAEKVIVTRGIEPGERILADPDAAQPGEKIRIAR